MQGSKSISYRVALATLFIVWLINFSGSLYDTYSSIGGNSGVWVDTCPDGGLCVKAVRSDHLNTGGLAPGDEILAIAGVSALPAGQMEFRNAMSQSRGRVTVKRDGAKLSLQHPVTTYRFAVLNCVKNLILGLLAVLVGWFGRPSKLSLSIISVLFLSTSIGQGAPIGPNTLATQTLLLSNLFSQVFYWPSLALGGLLMLDQNMSTKKLLAWSLGALPPAFLGLGYYGVSANPTNFFTIYFVLILTFQLCLGLTMMRLYVRTRPLSRRKANWLILGTAICIIMAVVSYIAGLYFSGSYMLPFLVSGELTAFVIGFVTVIAILKDDLIDIDRVAVISASYAILAVAFALLFEFVFEPLIGTIFESVGVDADIGQTLLIVAAVLGASRTKAVVSTYIERALLKRDSSKGDD